MHLVAPIAFHIGVDAQVHAWRRSRATNARHTLRRRHQNLPAPFAAAPALASSRTTKLAYTRIARLNHLPGAPTRPRARARASLSLSPQSFTDVGAHFPGSEVCPSKRVRVRFIMRPASLFELVVDCYSRAVLPALASTQVCSRAAQRLRHKHALACNKHEG